MAAAAAKMDIKLDKATGLVKHKKPKTIGEAADLLYDLKEQRLAMQRTCDAIEATEGALKKDLIERCKKSELDGAKGRRGKVEVRTKRVPRAEDWGKLYKHLKKSGEFDLLQRRLNEKAVQERWDAKKAIPGVGHFDAVTLGVSKA